MKVTGAAIQVHVSMCAMCECMCACVWCVRTCFYARTCVRMWVRACLYKWFTYLYGKCVFVKDSLMSALAIEPLSQVLHEIGVAEPLHNLRGRESARFHRCQFSLIANSGLQQGGGGQLTCKCSQREEVPLQHLYRRKKKKENNFRKQITLARKNKIK